MNVKNYTSSVPVERSVSLIEHNLVRVGAQHISKSYDNDGNLVGIMFQIPVNDVPLTFKLPSKWEKVFVGMMKEVRRPRPGTEKTVREQAQRTAWKLLYDMVAVQTSNIIIDQIDTVEAFMPYLYDGKRDRTLYEFHKERQFKGMLTMGKD